MKGFTVSLILLACIIALVTANVIYVNRTIDRLEQLAGNVRNTRTADAVNELYTYWEKYRSFVGLSVSLREIDSATENLLSLQAACNEGNDWLTEQSYVLFCNALEDIRRYEKITLLNIF